LKASSTRYRTRVTTASALWCVTFSPRSCYPPPPHPSQHHPRSSALRGEVLHKLCPTSVLRIPPTLHKKNPRTPRNKYAGVKSKCSKHFPQASKSRGGATIAYAATVIGASFLRPFPAVGETEPQAGDLSELNGDPASRGLPGPEIGMQRS